ncbi:hypothetical protein BG004_003795 [Podila humilis]|nr:hypothetical protein BG004_003795 [Podila humilis]
MIHSHNTKGYIQIEEDCGPQPSSSDASTSRTEATTAVPKKRIVNLRNVAMIPAVDAKNPKDMIRAKVLDGIMPLSRVPWTNAHSIVKQE